MLKARIFDLGGTVVDRYSLSPFLSLKEAFKLNNLIINQNLIFNDMGMDKRDHIQKILKDKYVHRNFVRNEGRFVDNNDVHQIYSDFNDIQLCR